MNPKRSTLRHYNQLLNVKDKERNLKLKGEKQLVTCEENPISQLADFSEEILQARKGVGRHMESVEG